MTGNGAGAGDLAVAPPRAADARMRLPREPYPGLRPFLDFEAALLFGRERQVREVIDGLRRSQFVAVLGGSGSGKSSLIHAGVVPELRSFGIPGAGDLWLPMTCTPGTNVSDADRSANRRSPVTRLARRFAQLLKSRGSEAADQQRLDEIAQVFRQEAGFARLLDAYGAELDLPPGPDPAEARVLFVLDQFEEVFHPTNKDVQDAEVLVERVLDHFFNPHPRCHVVLTMRSEHLNDCAAFLELPDAINKSSYLIRRLDTDELRDAILGPAQRFLRLVARSETSTRPLPAEVVFEPAVLQRLLSDVQSLTRDPDHLPLLQHLLARLWEAALQREEMDTLVPATITEIDLVRAVNAGGVKGDEMPLPPDLNTLRACVNNWPESIYAWHGPDERAQLDALFRKLAFKDPNTGAYSQQRVDVDESARQLGPNKGRADLKSLVGEGFLGSVDYLFWDSEDPARVTLKVSHESFIRGWLRFRALIDSDSVQFDEYLVVLRKCAEWVNNQRSEDYLLESGEMRRLGGSGFADRLRQTDRREAWARLLAMDRDGAHLAQAVGDMAAFMAASQHRQQQQRQRETRGRRTLVVALTLAVASTLLPTTLFSWLVQGPTMRRAELLFDAGNIANQALLNPSQTLVGDRARALESMLSAGALVDRARTGAGPWRTQVSKSLLDGFGNLPFFEDQRDFLDHVFIQAEPPINGKLRQLMQNAVWKAPAAGSEAAAKETLVAPARTYEQETCTGLEAGKKVEGRLFVQAREGRLAGQNSRALFVPYTKPNAQTGERELLVFSASFKESDGDPAPGDPLRCTLGAEVLKRPEALDSSVVFDASLRLFYYTAKVRENVNGLPRSAATLIVQEMDWERGKGNELYANEVTRTSLTDARAVEQVTKIAGEARAAVVPTYRVPGGRVVDMRTEAQQAARAPGPRWYVANTFAQRLPAVDPSGLEPLMPADQGSACAELSGAFAAMPGFKLSVFRQGNLCLRVSTGWPPSESGGSASRPLRDDVWVTAHEVPSTTILKRAPEIPPAPLAALMPFGRVTPSGAQGSSISWLMGTSGSLEGWLVMKTVSTPVGRSPETRYFGAPLSTCALWRMGRELLVHNTGPADGAKMVSRLGPACDRR